MWPFKINNTRTNVCFGHSTGRSIEREKLNENEDYEARAKEPTEKPSKASARVASQVAFLEAVTAQQKDAQQRQFEHDQKMQQQLQEFEERRDELRRKLEAELRQEEEEARQRMDRES